MNFLGVRSIGMMFGLWICLYNMSSLANLNNSKTDESLEDPNFIPQVFELPVLSIETKDLAPVADKEVYLDAEITVAEPIKSSPIVNQELLVAQIKGRGNSTWDMAKKPYRIKLKKAEEILGMPAHKDWALLANYSDKTLLRNQMALQTAAKLGFAWTPRAKQVEVFLNGQYQGLYLLTETITVDQNRVDVYEAGKKEDALAASEMGYLLEIDERLDEDFCFRTNIKNLPFCLKAPKAEQKTKDYIVNYLNDVESALFANDFKQRYPQLIDVQSFIDFYLLNEVAKNIDAKEFSSIYLHKDVKGKLKMGPVWDFDLGFGNANYNGVDNPDDFYVKLGPWFAQLFTDPEFELQVKKRWKETKSKIWDKLSEQIDNNSQFIFTAQENNFRRWLILDQYVWPNPVVTGTYEGEVDYLKTWIQKRILWLDQQWK